MVAVLDKKPDKGRKELAEHEIKRYERLLAQRSQNFDSDWQRLSDYYLPNMSNVNTEKTEDSTGWADRIFDVTGIQAARTCTTGQSNWATPSAEPWFQWSPPEHLGLEEEDEGAIWCGKCTDIALRELARSNYYRVSGQQYKNRTVFGTGHMHIEEGRDSLITCTARKIATYCVAVDEDGIVDTVYSEFKISARNAAAKWGSENLPKKIKKALEDNGGRDMDREFKFLHVIRPREETERVSGKIDAENKPIASIYISVEDKHCVSVGGYDEMPDSVTRFDEWGTGSVWGYSPAFECLPNVRQLNYVVRFMDAQYELRANPRILVPANLFGQIDLRPGGTTTYDPNFPHKPEEWMTQADIRSTEESVDKKRQSVNEMFYVDVFKALSQMQRTYKRPPTAYEISKVLGENLEQLSPMFGRLITEKCGPDLRRVFGILYRAGKFPQAPRSMYVASSDGRKLQLAMPEITFTSRLALALKSLQNRATVDTFEVVQQMAVGMGRPEILDNFDLDTVARKFALNQGMSPSNLRSLKDVMKTRAARAQQMQEERAMAMAEQAAGAAGKLGKAPQPLQEAVSHQLGAA